MAEYFFPLCKACMHHKDYFEIFLYVNVLKTFVSSPLASLRYLNVPMVTIFKNLTNVGILFGEWAFQGQPISSLVLLSCFMMLLGAVLAAANDITFSAVVSLV